jgi:AcrR family transcriptional regulator
MSTAVVDDTEGNIVRMGARGLRASEKRQRGDGILEAALDLFEHRGYDDTTIEDIAAAADVSPRTFFRYFDTKADLVLADDYSRPKKGLVERVATRPADEAPLDAVHHATVDLLHEVMTIDEGRALRQFRVALASPSLRPIYADKFHGLRPELIQAFAHRLGVKETSLAPRVLGAACAEAIWSAIETWVSGGAKPNRLEPILTETFETLKAGLI